MTDLMQYADVIKQKDQHDEGFQRSLIVVKGYLVDVENTGTPLVSARSGFVWVREYGANGGVFQAFLSPKVQARVELPVLIMYNPVKPFLRQVIDVDWSEMINYEDFDNQPLLGLHAQDHEWPDFTPGADPVNVYLRALVPLKTFPNVGLTVRMAPFVYEVDNEVREYFGETSIDLSAHQPASGEAVYVLTYFDVEANAAASVAGAPVADSPAVTPNIPDVPENAYQSALVRLDGDQTSFAEADIKDIRKLYEISKTSSIRGATLLDVATAVGEVEYLLSDHIVNHPSSGGGTPGGSNTQLQYNNGGAFGGFGEWNDTNKTLTLLGDNAEPNIIISSSTADDQAAIRFDDGAEQYTIGVLETTGRFRISAHTDLLGGNVVLEADYTGVSPIASIFGTIGNDPAFEFDAGTTLLTLGYVYNFNHPKVLSGYIFYSSATTQSFGIGGVPTVGDILTVTDGTNEVASFRSSAVVINNAAVDVDFRIAGNGVANGIYYDAGNNRLGIGTNAPTHLLHVFGSSASQILHSSGFTSTELTNLYFQTHGNNFGYKALIRGLRDGLSFGTNLEFHTTENAAAQNLRLRLKLGHEEAVFNNDELNYDFRIAGNGVTNGIYYDAGNNRTGFGTATPDSTVHIVGTAGITGFLNIGTTSNPPAGTNIIHVSGTSPGFWFTETDITDNNLFFVLGSSLMQFQNRNDAGTVVSSPVIIDMTSASNTFRIDSSRVGFGTNPTNVSAKVEISATDGALLLPRMTTTQRNALTAVNGMVIYNSTNNAIEGYENGSWVNL